MALENGSGSVGGNSQNIPEAHVPRTSSSFPLKAHRFNTERYGEYSPIFAMESVKEDKLPFRLSHQLLSYTMKKPLMQNVQKVKDLFSVPMECLFPLNWEKFFDNPVRGDDVAVDVGPTIENFWQKVGTLMQNLTTSLESVLLDSSTSDSLALQAVLRYLVIGEMFYSNGSLISSLNCHGAPYCEITKGRFDYTWDGFVDFFVGDILQLCSMISLESDGYMYFYNADLEPYQKNEHTVPFDHILCLLRDDPTGFISSVTSDSVDLKSDLLQTLQLFSFNFIKADVPFNNQFVLAYQICCAHFYSNDHIDFIYSAELYRQLLNHYTTFFNGAKTFSRNGLNYSYDSTSAHYFNLIVGYFNTTPSHLTDVLLVANGSTAQNDISRCLLGYLSAIFSYRRSLKYMDYFVGGRTQPLAVGAVGTGSPTSTTVPVNAGTVSVIDISRSIQAQRFLNSVNRFAHKFESYLKGLFGGRMPAPDYHNPFHLANVIDTVFGDETANTGDAQINPNGDSEPIAITTNLRGNSSKYMFEIDSDRPCVIIAIGHYDVARVHLRTMDRAFLHQDRFDYFNPFLQYIGDQSIYNTEIGINVAIPLSNFAYGLRHGEYKQLYNTASGGFVEYLPGFVFPAIDRRGTLANLHPEFIRCIQSEFDNFYTSLTGHSLASYFHFIVDNEIDCSGTRPMAFSPQILG